MSVEGESGVEKLLRKREVAAQLACSLRTVERLVSKGCLTRVKVMGAIRFKLSEVQAIVKGGVV